MSERQTRFDTPIGNNTSRGWSTSQSTVRPSPSPNVHKSRSKGISPASSHPRASSLIRSKSPSRPSPKKPSFKSKFQLSQDYRLLLPPYISRFIGYRPPGEVPPYEPLNIPPFKYLKHISLKYEIWLFSFIGSIIGIYLVELICSTNTIFRNIYNSPIVITSFGAAAVLLFGVIESPLAQPRNHIIGNLIGAIIGVALTKLFTLNNGQEGYREELENKEFHDKTFVNGGLVVSVTLLVTLVLGVVHPPAGATALAAATDPHIISMSWTYIPVVLSSSVLVIGWAVIINNLGRRRYPVYWWTPQRYFVKPEDDEVTEDDQKENDNSHNLRHNHSRARESEELALKTLEEGKLRKLEDGGRSPEALLIDRLQGHGGTVEDIRNASDGYFHKGQQHHNQGNQHDHDENEHNHNQWKAVHEPLSKVLSREDRKRAEGIVEEEEEEDQQRNF